jgi:hypothetical protein
MKSLAQVLTTADHSEGCIGDCGAHFACGCLKTKTVCRAARSMYPQGHGEDMGECAYRQAHPKEEVVVSLPIA